MMRTPIKRSKRPRRKSAHQSLMEEADFWVKAIVLERQQGLCLRQGMRPVSCGGPLQGAHILRKGGMYRSIRHELDNVVILCRNHHMFWAHLYEGDFYLWIEQIYPGRIERLRISAQMARKVDLKELICVLKNVYENLPPHQNTLCER
jgi:hypothetical protein